MKYSITVLLVIILSFGSFAQVKIDKSINPDKPKLVVGVVVDQMRYDYLTRFWKKYGNEGFKRLVTEGYNFKNNHFNYIPTYTAPGHASVYTGTTPQNHGIISNSWYNKFEERYIYCVTDENVQPLGTNASAGQMSPNRLSATTIADENRLFTQMRGKTIGIALKDRGAILPAGHTANAAYWFHGQEEGKWISSTFYMEELPKWVKEFNISGTALSYMKPWDAVQKLDSYSESGVDENLFETGFNGKKTASFPYDLQALGKDNGNYDLLKATPYGNSLTTDFAIAAIKGEELGKDEFTDFLTVSFSSTDYVGHNFGVNSKEIEDAYLRLDLDLARLLSSLDDQVGEGNYTLFLTADHGGGDVPTYLTSVKIPSGYFDDPEFDTKLKEFIFEKYKKEDLVESVSNYQVFFNYRTLAEAEIDRTTFEKEIAHFILQYPKVSNVFTRSQLESGNYTEGISGLVQRGFNQKRSGDVIFVLDPAVISYTTTTGSTHGSGFSYDTHAPLIFFGKGIKQGSTAVRSEIVDIAPTISVLLGIAFPNSATGIPLNVVLEK
ncbi:type I phosphodiesterase/nucleotide pyrophosphatase [Gillisia mitskevichiae]|uniref:Type I phosphodiesterase/nucleotide pyrophosphatase n=1 Tax=Gillisia mitskevichiae TaxID=270921 RepID=A0A495P523_9FLAO|nr:alkaline phosphatase PafA [Gillisia mitskevichiae]RKS44920.1 type I phosphodiesterase/nucleotide pyrophosphatase [Gillisia mitskevichiae]